MGGKSPAVIRTMAGLAFETRNVTAVCLVLVMMRLLSPSSYNRLTMSGSRDRKACRVWVRVRVRMITPQRFF